MAKKQIDLGLTGLDELFMDDRERAESKLPKIHEIPLSEIDEFPNHPFHVRLDEDMEQLVESIKERGIITPVTLRQKPDGRYEIVSGHRRTKACELAGLATVKAEIKELSRDEAIILMVESNLQRTTILPSEKAFSYKMRLEAMKHQAGRPSKENASPVATNSTQGRSDVELGEQVGESKDQVRRYIRLTNLIGPLLDLVDAGKIAFRPAVELSYLTEEEQNSLLDSISSEQSTPSLTQALKMKEFSQNGRLNADVILSIMCEQKPNQREKISFQSERLKPFIPKNFTATITEIQTANGYTLLKNAITVTISLKENPAKPCNVYAKDVLGVLQNDPHYAFDGGEDLKLANIPQRALSHNYPTASATVDKNDVTMLEDNGSANAEVPLTVKNTKGFDLPKTGDHGTWMYSLVGILLMSTAAGVIVLTVKKKNGR